MVARLFYIPSKEMIKKKNVEHLLLLLLAFLPISANAEVYDFKVDGIYYNILSSYSVEVTYKAASYASSYASSSTSNRFAYHGNVTIPDSVTYNGKTYTVKRISEGAFYGCSSLDSITISNNVDSIGYSAFQGCTSLTSVSLPNNITTIGKYTFYGCSSLSSIDLPESLISIGNYAFEGCYRLNLGNSKFPESLISIGDYAFYNCASQIGHVITIPKNVESISSTSFDDVYFSHLVILSQKLDSYSWINKVSKIINLYAYRTAWTTLKNYSTFNALYDVLPRYVSVTSRYLRGMDFCLEENSTSYLHENSSVLKSVVLDGEVLYATDDYEYEVSDLPIVSSNTTRDLVITYLDSNDNEYEYTATLTQYGLKYYAKSSYERTQTTITINITPPSDKTACRFLI